MWKERHRDSTGNKVKEEYKYISMFVFRRFRGHCWVCLHTYGHTGEGGFLAVRTHHAHREWQETKEEFRRGSGDGWVGQQDGKEGEQPIRMNGEALAVSSHTEEGFFIVSTSPLVKLLLMSMVRSLKRGHHIHAPYPLFVDSFIPTYCPNYCATAPK